MFASHECVMICVRVGPPLPVYASVGGTSGRRRVGGGECKGFVGGEEWEDASGKMGERDGEWEDESGRMGVGGWG